MEMLPEALRLARVFHDLTQTELAQKLAISNSYLSEIESGKKQVTLDLLDKYAKVFDVPVSSLIFFSESVRTPSVSERSRVFIAKKAVRMMKWLAAKELHSDEAKT